MLNIKKGKFNTRFGTLFLICMLVFATFTGLFIFKNDNSVTSATTYHVGGSGAGNYSTIQAAIDTASAGDTVFVYAGTYYENVYVNKTLNLIGEDRSNTTIDGNGTNDVIQVNANEVFITGFTVKNCGNTHLNGGIKLNKANRCSIISNNASSNGFSGMILLTATNNIIKDNIISFNIGTGLMLRYSSSHNSIINNSINNNCLNNNTEFAGLHIIYLSNNNIFSKNRIYNNNIFGITIYYSDNNIMNFNLISGNKNGVTFQSTNKGHIFYLNEFLNNTNQVIGESSYRSWNSPEKISYIYNNKNFTNYLGNYWDDYTGYDNNSDGIGDSPYVVGADNDQYPLIKRLANYKIIPSSTKVDMIETYSNTTNKTVSITTQIARLNATITGDLSGYINVTELELVRITSGPYAGSGFFKGIFRASIESRIYEGHWHGSMFNRSGESKYYLKGTLFGGVQGITDGYLMESKLGSGKYDVFNSTCILSHLRVEERLSATFAQLILNGTLDVQRSKVTSSEIYILQALFKGNATGYYNKSLSVVLTHIRINNESHEYYGYGFSKISYISAWGSGSGWTYDRTISPLLINLTGFFTQPLWGIVFGLLNETGAKRTLSLTIIRLDLGSQPTVDVKISVWGPSRASPGQTFNYFIEYMNIGFKSAYNTEIVLALPTNVTYIYHSGSGTYHNSTHEITWRLNISAKSRDKLAIKCKLKWNLTLGTNVSCTGYIRDYVKNITLASYTWRIFLTLAVDPNIKYGPDGFVIPGQVLNYRIEFENEGKGIAYGVYFTDTLSEYLDDSTLKIGSVFSKKDNKLLSRPGIYDRQVRTITWFVGEVGPCEGGYADFSIQVPNDAVIGTEILNYGVVYFPSVPEVTKTNGIISIVTINKNPTALAGNDLVVKTLEEVLFDGSGSFDQDGTIINYTWDFGDGNFGYGREIIHSYQDDGNYIVKLTVLDNWGGIDSDEITIQVLNREPQARLEVDLTEVNTNEVVTFYADQSTDLDGMVVNYYFDFGDNSNSGWIQTPSTTHRYSDGTKIYTVELSIMDDDDAIGKDVCTVTVNNVKPIADFEINPRTGDVTTIFEFSSKSFDTDGSITNYFWSFGDGATSNEISPVHQYKTTGTYTVSLTVQDDDGADSDVLKREITIKNLPPVAIAKSSVSSAKVGEKITFDGSESYDIDGKIIGFEWHFGDGTIAHTESVKHSYSKAGTYTVVLIVLDNSDDFTSTSFKIEIIEEMPDFDGDLIPDELDPDDDNDGLPDDWEVKYGLNPYNPEDADIDSDNDGLTNLQEYNLGTDPTDPDTDDDSFPDNVDPYPLDPSRPGVDKKDDEPTKNNNLLIAIIMILIIIIIIILTSIILRSKNKRINKPFDTDEYIKNVRDNIVEGNIPPDTEAADTVLWTNLETKYQNGQISEETYRLLEEEKKRI